MTHSIKLTFGDVRKKKIVTGNHFVSHMLEHIAWRMGLSIELEFIGEDWAELGRRFGTQIAMFAPKTRQASAFGMIDDGSAIVRVALGERNLELSAVNGIEMDWFLGLRCEQVSSGRPLVELMEGLCRGLCARISVQVWNVEDTHHTWEGIYRGIGIALSKIYMPAELNASVAAELESDKTVQKCNSNPAAGADLAILEAGVQHSTVYRGTAETGITASVDFGSDAGVEVHIDVDQSIRVATAEVIKLLESLSRQLGASLKIEFRSKELSSSHVVMEDIGLVLGRALLEILRLRMEGYGVNGAGSNLSAAGDAGNQAVDVGISVEGRKFWRVISEDGDAAKLKQKFLIGQDVLNGLRSEDLDDFLDGLAGGMSASIMVHVKDYSSPSRTWQDIFAGLGSALREVFETNAYRKGVPPGVKATLA